MPFRLVMLLVLALGAVLLGHVGARALAHDASHAAVRHHALAHGLHAHAAHNHGEALAVALYDDDDDDDDGDDGLVAPPAQDDDEDAAPGAVAEAAHGRPLPMAGRTSAFEPDELGPASGHARPDERPPRA